MFRKFCDVITGVIVDSCFRIGEVASLMDLKDYATIAGVVIGGAIFWYIKSIPTEPLLIPPEFNGVIVVVSGILCFLPLVLI